MPRPIPALPGLALALLCGVAAAQEPAPKRQNRLAQEQSPYLRQHARNPVDWYPWGPEAFAKAKREGKLIFLSIGYATCHWCHVMERESFENEAVARYLNEHYVAIKVDREERPDVDQVYMTAIQLATGSGGWPLSVFLLPDGKPLPDVPQFEQTWGSSLTGGTYMPQPARYGRRAFLAELQVRADLWKKEPKQITQDSARWADHVRQALVRRQKPLPLSERALERGFEALKKSFDTEHAGFGLASKFPIPHSLAFLLRYHLRSGDEAAKDMALRTLDAIARGGLRDHLGGGFHRYAVDRTWTIPHFEKMLYDQASLARVFVEAHQLTGEDRFAEVARETLDFVLRDMRSAEGAFTSAWDADSEGKEGKFYVWSHTELRRLLGPDYELFAQRYGVREQGNFREGEEQGTNHLQVQDSLQTLAKRHGAEVPALRRRLAKARQVLLAARRKRVPPLHDDKVLTDWNGLAIGAFALAGRALGEERYVAAAAQAAEFVLSRLRVEGQLRHRWRGGQAAIPAMLADYAFLTDGLIDLYEASGEARWLVEARALVEAMHERLWDPSDGGYFQVEASAGLLARPKPFYDGAIPSGNGAAASALLRLSSFTGEQVLYERGRKTLEWYSRLLTHRGGDVATQGLCALDLLLGPRRELVIAGDPAAEETKALLAEAHRRFLPRTALIVRPAGEAKQLFEVAKWTKAQTPREGKPTAYLCTNFACQAPVHDAAALRKLLGKP